MTSCCCGCSNSYSRGCSWCALLERPSTLRVLAHRPAEALSLHCSKHGISRTYANAALRLPLQTVAMPIPPGPYHAPNKAPLLTPAPPAVDTLGCHGKCAPTSLGPPLTVVMPRCKDTHKCLIINSNASQPKSR